VTVSSEHDISEHDSSEHARMSSSVNRSTSPGLVRCTSERAGYRRRCRVAVRSTPDRLAAAWHHSPSLARHSMMAACATSVALVVPLRTTAVVAGTTATVGVLLAAAALVDTREHRLPNRLLAFALLVALGGALLSADVAAVRNALLGMVLAGGLLLLAHLSRGVGMGDVKMAAVVGASTAAATNRLLAAPIAIAMAAFAAATYGFLTSRRRVAFGPALWFGWASALALVTAMTSNGWLS